MIIRLLGRGSRRFKPRPQHLLLLSSLFLLITLPHSSEQFGSSPRRSNPPPPPQNGRPGQPPSIRRQGLPHDGGSSGSSPSSPPQQSQQHQQAQQQSGGGPPPPPPPIGHRRINNHHHHHHGPPPPPPHGKHRGRPPFPFPRRRPPPPPPRGRGPPPPRDRDAGRPPYKQPPPHQQDNNNNNNNNNNAPPKLSFHIPPAPMSTPSAAPPPTEPVSPQQQQFGQQRPTQESHNFQQQQPPFQNNNNGFNNNQNQNQFHQQQQQQQFQPPNFPQQQQQFQNNNNNNQQQQGGSAQPQFNSIHPQQQPQFPPPLFPNNNNNNQFQQPPTPFAQGAPPHHPPQPQFNNNPGPSHQPPITAFNNGAAALPHQPPTQFNNIGPSHQPPFMNPSQMPPLPPQFPQNQAMFGQINPSSMPQQLHQNNNPNQPPILEYAPPPNTFNGNNNNEPMMDENKELDNNLNTIPKQTITFTVTPKPSKNGGTQLHFKISTPKPFKTTLKPIASSKGYFKGSTYRPPVDKLSTKFKYASSNPGYPDTEYRINDGSRRDSSMSAEMEPPGVNADPDSIKDVIMNREHSLNQPAQPHPDDTDNYAGPSYNSPPIYVKPNSGEEVLIAGITGGKSNYHKGAHSSSSVEDSGPFRTQSGVGPPPPPQFEEDYDNGPILAHDSPFGGEDDGDIGSKLYSDRHLPTAYSPGKDQNSFDEYPPPSKHEDHQYMRRPGGASHSAEDNHPYDEYNNEGGGQPRGKVRPARPHLHIDEESLHGSAEKNRASGATKFSQPDPLYHPEEDGGSSGSKEQQRNRADPEFTDMTPPRRFEGYTGGFSSERGSKLKDKEYRDRDEDHHAASSSSSSPPSKSGTSKSTAEELLAALGLSTNPLVSMPSSKYPVDIPTKYSLPGSWEKDYTETENKRKPSGSGSGGEPMGLLEYLNQKKEEEGTSNTNNNNNPVEPLYSVPDRQIGGAAENSFVVQGSMKTAGITTAPLHPTPAEPKGSNNVIVGRPIPQFQGTEPDLPSHYHNHQQTEHSSYIEQKIKAAHGSASSPLVSQTGHESYLFEKIHGVKHVDGVPVINTGLYGPSVPPPISDPGTFTNGPPSIASLPSASPAIIPQYAPPPPQQQPSQLIQQQQPAAGQESYLFQKIHGGPPAKQPALAFGPTPPSPHSVEDVAGLYGGAHHHHHHQTGLYASPSEQVAAATVSGQASPSGVLYPQKQVSSSNPLANINNGVLLPVGMGVQNSIPPTLQQRTAADQQQAIASQNPFLQGTILPYPSPAQPQQQQQQLVPQQSAPVQQQIIAPPQQQPPQMTAQQALQQAHQAIHQAHQQQALQQAHQQLQQQALQQATQQQALLQQQTQHVPQIVAAPPPSPPPQNAYNSDGIDRSHIITPHISAEQTAQQQQLFLQQFPQQHPHFNNHNQQQHHIFQQQQPSYQNEPSISGSSHSYNALPPQHLHNQNQLTSASGVNPKYGDPYPVPVYVPEPDPIIEIIVQDSNMTLPPLPTHPPPPPPPPPTPEPVHVFYVKYSQKNNTPVFDNYYGPSEPHIQLEQPISSVPVRGPDRNGLAVVDDHHHHHHQDSHAQSSIHHQSVYNNVVYSTSTESPQESTTTQQGIQTTLRTVIRPDRNEFHHQSQGLVVSFDKPAIEHEIFANYTNSITQLQNEQQSPEQNNRQYPEQNQQQYPEITFPPQQQQQYQYAHHDIQQQGYPGLEALYAQMNADHHHKNSEAPQEQQQQGNQFNKRIGLQELASLLENGPQQQQGPHQQDQSQQQQQQSEQYHHQQGYEQSNNEEPNPAPLYQYVENSQQTTRQAKLPDDVPEELRNQLVQSGILGNADVQVINYSENLFKELGELPPEAFAAFQAHTNAGTTSNKQMEASGSEGEWSGSQMSLSGTSDLSTLLPSGRSLRQVLVVKNSLRPKRGGRQRRVVLLITDKQDVLLYRPKDRSIRRVGSTSNPVLQRAIQLANHKTDDSNTHDNTKS